MVEHLCKAQTQPERILTIPKCWIVIAMLFLLFAQTSWPQLDDRSPGYHNSEPPNRGSFHTRQLQETVTAQDGSRFKSAKLRCSMIPPVSAWESL